MSSNFKLSYRPEKSVPNITQPAAAAGTNSNSASGNAATTSSAQNTRTTDRYPTAADSGPSKEPVTASDICSKAFQQRQQARMVVAGPDAQIAARERDSREEAVSWRERERLVVAQRQAQVREQQRDNRDLAQWRNGTLSSGYDEDEKEFQAWLKAGHGWRD